MKNNHTLMQYNKNDHIKNKYKKKNKTAAHQSLHVKTKDTADVTSAQR